MRISSVAIVLLLAACGRAPDTPAGKRAMAGDDGHVLCARGGAALQRRCTVEQTPGRDGVLLTLRHADGGFRRLRISTDGRGVITADGAEDARVAIVGPGDIEVTVGSDRYRLPATVKGAAQPS